MSDTPLGLEHHTPLGLEDDITLGLEHNAGATDITGYVCIDMAHMYVQHNAGATDITGSLVVSNRSGVIGNPLPDPRCAGDT